MFSRMLVNDLNRHATEHREKSHRAHANTRRKPGDSAFADYCHTLGEAHAEAARVYDRIADQVERNSTPAQPRGEG